MHTAERVPVIIKTIVLAGPEAYKHKTEDLLWSPGGVHVSSIGDDETAASVTPSVLVVTTSRLTIRRR